jgi:hypothetical protein
VVCVAACVEHYCYCYCYYAHSLSRIIICPSYYKTLKTLGRVQFPGCKLLHSFSLNPCIRVAATVRILGENPC